MGLGGFQINSWIAIRYENRLDLACLIVLLSLSESMFLLQVTFHFYRRTRDLELRNLEVLWSLFVGMNPFSQ